MTEPNATPAPLTSERCSKRVPMAGVWFRDAQCSRKAVGMFDGAPLCRQHSPAAKAARDAKYEAKFKARLARDMAPTVRLSEALAELDATRAKLAEAEAQRDAAVLAHEACPACGLAFLRPGELQVQIDALREVSACRAALEEVGYTGSLPVGVYEKLADERAELSDRLTAAESRVAALTEALRCAEIGMCAVGVPHPGERETLQMAVDMVRAALSPSQDAKGGA